ncbi:MAG: NUDIX domain-containing protein [Flavobacteriales bacterium]|nr:NUDIX domain-containing protein [Flavobacteriales bacterium]
MYKVFIQNIPVIFTNSPTGECPDIIEFSDDIDFIDLHQNMSDLYPNGLEIICDKVKRSWKIFKSHFKVIKAGGGVVENEEGKILFIFRLKKWDLPKGKLDPGETIAQCALREVEEECNLKNIELNHLICKTYHTYTTSKNYMMKISYWYGMTVEGDQELIPQTKENITDVRWFDPFKLSKPLSNTYGAVTEVIRQMGLLEPIEDSKD